MATDRVYGKFQWAGVKVTTAAKSQINQDGTDAYAMLVSDAGGSAAFATGQVSVPSTTNGALIAAARAGRRSITIVNSGTTAVSIGAPATGLTSANGVILPGVAGASITLPTAAAVYGIAASGSQTVSYVETY